MYQSKLLTILKTCTPGERQKFRAFVHSPLYNKNRRLQLLIETIMVCLPNFQDSRLDKKRVFPAIFGNAPYNELVINNLISGLVKLLEDFLAIQRLAKDPVEKRIKILSEFRERKLDQPFHFNVIAARKALDKYPFRNDRYYRDQYLLESEVDHFFMQSGLRKQDESIRLKVQYLDLFYLSAKLQNSCELINRQNIIGGETEVPMLKELLDYVKNNLEQFDDAPAIKIYYYILLALQPDGSEEHYQTLISLLNENDDLFPEAEARAMYNYARNFCIRQINSGNSAYLKEIFSIYTHLLERGTIFEGKYLTQWDYKNIIAVSIRLKEYDWAAWFIEAYKGRLDPAQRKNAYTFNLAALLYEKKQFGDAMQLLLNVEFTDVYYSLGAKSLLMRIYYELEEDEALFSLIKAFRIYLKRNKLISTYQQTVHLNLIRFTNKAFRLKTSRNFGKKNFQKEVMVLKNKINSTSQVTNLEWLKQKVSELDNW